MILSMDEINMPVLNSPVAPLSFIDGIHGPVNPLGSCRAPSVYLNTHFLGMLSNLRG